MVRRINITNAERCAYYIRDRFQCLWCSRRIVPGAPTHCLDAATLDHIEPYHEGGRAVPTNLMTVCGECNSRRKGQSLQSWLLEIERYGRDVKLIQRELRNRRRRKLDVRRGAELAERVAQILEQAARLTRAMLVEGLFSEEESEDE